MPSPFPGMDPYLEHPSRWPGFHSKLINEIQTLLSEQLAPDYHVNLEERVFISDSRDDDLVASKSRVPDVMITTSRRLAERVSSGSAMAVAKPIVVADWSDDTLQEMYITIVDEENREAVTIIELLSPTNKTAGTHGRRTYQTKRKSIMRSKSHLVEIDLLRAGRPASDRKNTPYCVTSSVVGNRPDLLLWPISLNESLPRISIPLRAKQTHPFDLQNAFNITYDRGGYGRRLNYAESPIPPLRKEWRAWAKKLV